LEEFNSLIIRYSEIGLKSPLVRREMERLLISNIRETYLNENVHFINIIKRASRIIAYTSDVRAKEITRYIFGIKSYSPSLEVEADIDVIKRASLRLAKAESGSFAVRVQRVTKNYPMTSIEIAKEVGAFIKGVTGRPVNLRSPDQEIIIEIVERYAYITDEKIQGYGGLPVGSQGKVVALISGGIDSPVAAWLMMKRGAQIIPVHFRKTEEEEECFRRIVSVLRKFSYGAEAEPIVVEHGPILAKYQEYGAREWICLLCKRRMLVMANRIAKEVGANAIVTGDSLGQVASQTLHNLEIESRCLEKPILRPLIGMDKEEIVKIAKEIGTYEISISHGIRCPFVPKRPKTRGKWNEFIKVVRKVGEDELLEVC